MQPTEDEIARLEKWYRDEIERLQGVLAELRAVPRGVVAARESKFNPVELWPGCVVDGPDANDTFGLHDVWATMWLSREELTTLAAELLKRAVPRSDPAPPGGGEPSVCCFCDKPISPDAKFLRDRTSSDLMHQSCFDKLRVVSPSLAITACQRLRDLSTKLRTSFDPGGNLPEDCSDWATEHEAAIDEIHLLVMELLSAAEAGVRGTVAPPAPEPPQKLTLKEALALVFELSDAEAIEIHSGDREPGTYITRSQVAPPSPSPAPPEERA